MTRRFVSFPIGDLYKTKLQMLNWVNRFNIFCLLDNQQYNFHPHSFECVLGAGCLRSINTDAGNAFNLLQSFYNSEKDWLFGHLGYDLKNEIENLKSSLFDGILFPDLYFFVPEIIIQLNGKDLIISSHNEDEERIYQQIMVTEIKESISTPSPIKFKSRIEKREYIKIIESLQKHILRGDCYEINYCQEFFSEEVVIDPLQIYLSLSHTSPNPFSGFYRVNDKFLICASPERYLKKTGYAVISQPIKGTSQRVTADVLADEKNKRSLSESPKERSENVMIVDLVRNDLSKVCEEGSVQVDELFGVYSFPVVHQMISTITGRLKKEIQLIDIFRATFPMGSMTGAPKKKVMELIEQYEKTRRGIFSGAVGYITPQGDFDFNVVIRSILYNASRKYVSFQAGSGITYYSDPLKEYEECLLKAAAIKKVLTGEPIP